MVEVEFRLGELYSGEGDGTRRQEHDALGARTELLFYRNVNCVKAGANSESGTRAAIAVASTLASSLGSSL